MIIISIGILNIFGSNLCGSSHFQRCLFIVIKQFFSATRSFHVRNSNRKAREIQVTTYCSLVQASGVSVSVEVKVKYDEIKKKKTHRYLIFFIKDEKTIAIEKIGTAQRCAEIVAFINVFAPIDLNPFNNSRVVWSTNTYHGQLSFSLTKAVSKARV